MPLSAFQPGQANSQALSDLAAVGILPGSANPVVQALTAGTVPMAGATTASGQPDLASQSQAINSQLNMVGLGNMAGPTSNQAGATQLLPGAMPASLSNQASAADTGAIFDQYQAGQMNPQQPGPTTSAAQRLALAQGAVTPTVGQQQQMVNPTAAAVDTGASGNGNGNGSSATPYAVNPLDPTAMPMVTPQQMNNASARLQAAQNVMGTVNPMDPTAMPVQPSAVPTPAQVQAYQAGPSIERTVGNAIAPALVNAQPPAAPAGAPQVPGTPAGTPQVPAGQPASAPTPNTAGPRVAPVAAPTGVPAGVPAGVPQVAPQTPQAPLQQGPTTNPPAPVAPPKGPLTADDLAQAIYGQESGYGRNTTTSPTGAVGGMQIEPATFKQYAFPGEDINNPTDNMNVGKRIIADLYQKAGGDPQRVAVGYFSGPDNISPPGSPTPWIKDKSDGNTSVSQYVNQVMSRLGQPAVAGSSDAGGNRGGSYDPAVVEPATNALFKANPGMVNDSLAAVGLPGFDLDKLPFPNAYNSKLSSTGLIATGLAMMGGRTWADSMKQGGQALAGAEAADRQSMQAGNSEALNMMKTSAQLRLSQAEMQMRMAPQRMGAPVQQANGSWTQPMLDRTTGMLVQVPTGSPASYANSDPTRKGQQALATDSVKENMASVKAATDPSILNSANDTVNSANALLAEIQKNPQATGGSIGARINRYITEQTGMNLTGVDPNDLNLQQKLTTQLNTGGIFSQTHGNISRVTQGEMTSLAKGWVSDQTNPAAAAAIVNSIKEAAQRNIDRANYANTISSDPTVLTTPGEVNRRLGAFIGDQQKARGSSDYVVAPGQAPQSSQGSTSQPKGASRAMVQDPTTGNWSWKDAS